LIYRPPLFLFSRDDFFGGKVSNFSLEDTGLVEEMIWMHRKEFK